MEKTTGKYRVLGIYLLLAGLTFVAYKQVLYHQFTNFDDNVYITENPYIQKGLTFENIRWAFTTGRSSNWHPITWLSHIVDYEMFGLNPWGHHLVNVLLHTANTLLLFGVLNAMTGAVWQSAFVAALFALHPLRIESVAWAAERKDVLSGLFFMLTVAAYLHYVRQRGIKWYLLTILLFVMGLMAKPMLVTLPFVLLLLDYWPLGRFEVNRPAKLVREKIPFFVLSAVSSVVTFFVQQSGGAVNTMKVVTPVTRITNAMVSYMAYLEKIVWPSRLAVLYPYSIDGLPVQQVIKAVLLLVGIFLLVIQTFRNHRYLITGWLWYLGILVPVIGLVQVGSQAMADRYTYLPSIGIFIMAAWGISEISVKWRYRKIILGISSFAVLSAFSICTYLQSHYWQNSVTLFEHTLKVTSNNSLAYSNLGFAYIKLGRYNEAIEACKQAIRIRSDDAKAHYNLGIVYDELGRRQEAIEAFEQTIRIKPDYVEAHNNLGVAYSSLGRYQDAIEAYKQAIKIKPDYAEAHNNLGVTYSKLGGDKKAMEAFKQAVEIKPDYAEAHNNLGIAYLAKGDRSSALEEYKILKTLDAELANKLFNLIYK
jgi:Flp pilus assembly protein TadD